tara:strand:- start:1470 stop:1643 length:174 start_codon:yes stop_codon:yes gene_type:complete
MSYIYTQLPKLEDLKQAIKTNPNLLRYYSKYESFLGSTKSVNYLKKKLKEYYENKTN